MGYLVIKNVKLGNYDGIRHVVSEFSYLLKRYYFPSILGAEYTNKTFYFKLVKVTM